MIKINNKEKQVQTTNCSWFAFVVFVMVVFNFFYVSTLLIGFVFFICSCWPLCLNVACSWCCSLVLFSVPYHCLCSVFFGFVSWACFSLFLILLFDFVFVMFPLFLCYLVWLFVLVLCSLINVVRVFGCSCYVFCYWLCYVFLVVGSCLGVLMFRLWFHSVLLLWLLLFVIC